MRVPTSGVIAFLAHRGVARRRHSCLAGIRPAIRDQLSVVVARAIIASRPPTSKVPAPTSGSQSIPPQKRPRPEIASRRAYLQRSRVPFVIELVTSSESVSVTDPVAGCRRDCDDGDSGGGYDHTAIVPCGSITIAYVPRRSSLVAYRQDRCGTCVPVALDTECVRADEFSTRS